MIQLRAAGATDPGRVRSVNQDRYLIATNRLYVVADGMGGHRGGEVAAQMTVESLGAHLESLSTTNDLVQLLQLTNQTVLDRSNEDPELRGMGTTVTAVALFNPSAKNPVVSILNVGDSRTYRMRAGELEQLTDDHSVVAELMRTGQLSPEEARGHRQRSVLTRALGVEPELETDTLEVLVNSGDRFLLCSDGLYTEVPDVRIAAVLRQLGDPAEASKELVRLALQNGGRDNITVLIIDAFDDRDPSYIASQELGTAATFGGSIVAANPLPSKVGMAATNAALEATTDGNERDGHTGGHIGGHMGEREGKTAARKPWAVNFRVVLFLAVLAALGAVVIWAVKAGKEISSDTTIVNSTVTSSSNDSTSIATPSSLPPQSSVAPQAGSAQNSGSSTATTLSRGPSIPNANPAQPASTAVNQSASTNTDGSPRSSTSPLAPGTREAPAPIVSTTLDPFDPAQITKAPKVRKKKRIKSASSARSSAKSSTKSFAKPTPKSFAKSFAKSSTGAKRKVAFPNTLNDTVLRTHRVMS